MAKNIYINAAARNAKEAFVQSAESPRPTGLPVFTLGDIYDINLYLVDGSGGYDANSGSGSLSVKFGVGNKGAAPTSGTFTLTDGTDTTSALNYNCTASEIQTALNALNTATGPFGDTVTVTGSNPFLVTFDSTGAVASLLQVGTNSLNPNSGVSFAEVTAGDGSTQEQQSLYITQSPVVFEDTWGTVSNGWSAQVGFNTFELKEYIGAGTEQTTAWLEIEITDGSGNRITRAQAQVTINNEVISDSALYPVNLANYSTTNELNALYIHNKSAITGLTGGGSTNLDGLITAGGAIASNTLVGVEVSGEMYFYELVSGTDAESSPEVIRPDDYATTTNEVVWKQRTMSANTTASSTLSITGTGSSSVTPTVRVHTVHATVAGVAYSSPYTHNVLLKDTSSTSGDIIHIKFSLPTDVDPNIKVYDDTTGGTLLLDFNSTLSGNDLHAIFGYNGTEWVCLSYRWIADTVMSNEILRDSLTSAASMVIDFDGASVQTLALSHNPSFTTTNRPSNTGISKEVRVRVDANGASRTLTFSSSWKWATTEPSTLASGAVAMLVLAVDGSAETDVTAAWVQLT